MKFLHLSINKYSSLPTQKHISKLLFKLFCTGLNDTSTDQKEVFLITIMLVWTPAYRSWFESDSRQLPETICNKMPSRDIKLIFVQSPFNWFLRSSDLNWSSSLNKDKYCLILEIFLHENVTQFFIYNLLNWSWPKFVTDHDSNKELAQG